MYDYKGPLYFISRENQSPPKGSGEGQRQDNTLPEQRPKPQEISIFGYKVSYGKAFGVTFLIIFLLLFFPGFGVGSVASKKTKGKSEEQ